MTDYSSAIRDMLNRDFCGSERYREQQTRADRFGAHPDILEFEKRLVTKTRKQGIPLFAHCVWRGREEQERLLGAGHSKARFGSSPHNYGMAVDIIHGTKAWALDNKSWEMLGHIGKEISVQSGIGITWGGDWGFFDPAHWELEQWRNAAMEMEAGERWLL